MRRSKLSLESPKGLLAVPQGLDTEPGTLEVVGDELDDVGVVLDDEHAPHGCQEHTWKREMSLEHESW
jgi:hypothetical protein